MFHLDNSETSWLVYADWLEDQDIDASHIRESVVNPITTDWHFIYRYNSVGISSYGFDAVGDDGMNTGVGITEKTYGYPDMECEVGGGTDGLVGGSEMGVGG